MYTQQLFACLRPAIAHVSAYSIAVPWLVCVTIADASPSALVFVQAEFELHR